MCGVYPTADAKTAGNEISSTYEGRHITLLESELIHPKRASGFVEKGDPVCAFAPGTGGVSVGVAFNGGVATDLIAIDTEGIWNLNVWSYDDDGGSAINHGDQLFIDFFNTGATIALGVGSCAISKISNTNTNIPFGYALGYVAASGDGNIAVKVHFDPPDNWLCDGEPLWFGDAKDLSLIHRGDKGYGGILCATEWTVAGETGRPFESRLTTNERLGGWANAFKAYVDLQTKGGAAGLLSASCHEVLMATAGIAGAVAAVEMEIVYGATCGNLPQPSFMWMNTDGVARGDFDSYGDLFKISSGPTPGAGLFISADTNTLRVGTGVNGSVKRYLPLSLTENILHYNVAALANDGRMARFLGTVATPLMGDGSGAFEVQLTVGGVGTGHDAVHSVWLNVPDTGTLAASNNHNVHSDGIWLDNSATVTTTVIAWARIQYIFGTNVGYTDAHILDLNLDIDQNLTSLINVNNLALVGYVGGAHDAAVVGSLPFIGCGASVKYIRLYDELGA